MDECVFPCKFIQKREIMSKRKPFKMEHWKLIALFLGIYDVVAVNLSYLAALWIRFDASFQAIPKEYLSPYSKLVPVYSVVSIIVFICFRLYHSVWRFASYKELVKTTLGSFVASVIHTVAITSLMSVSEGQFKRMPISYYVWGALFQVFLLLAIRFSYRFLLLELRSIEKLRSGENHGRIMIIGAGAAGQLLLRDISKGDKISDKVCCIIDDNANKWRRYIDGVPIAGGRDDILNCVKKYRINKIYVAIPSAPKTELRDILNICNETDCEIKNLPGVYQFVNGDITVASMKDVSVEDLLGRDVIEVNNEQIFDSLFDKVIMVTGGGGSIGSELCRQIAAHNPKQLIIFDVYENNAYDIQQELKKKYPSLNLVTLIGSVRDSRRLDRVFAKYTPEIVFHAAAHKHVPLMEDSPCESIKNNVIGTYKTAYAAAMNNCKKFVLISTDKAVNPTNIMGCSKRACEMVIQGFDYYIKNGKSKNIPKFYTHIDDNQVLKNLPEDAKTEFVAVRFGNVLGSNGSVIPLFRKQIEAGGPVTVTHPDIIRYFMTIPEAVRLVLTAGTFAKGGEIFVLDMGSPVKIDTLARNLIKLSGLKPDVDIKIEYTGLRPGEKLYEEKLMAEEGMRKTPNDLIHIGNPIPFDVSEFFSQLETLMAIAYRNDEENIRPYVKQIVDTYNYTDKN